MASSPSRQITSKWPEVDDSGWSSFYRLLAATGLPRPTLEVDVVVEGTGEVLCRAALAWPDLHVGLLIDDVVPAGAAKAGWTLCSVKSSTFGAIATLLGDLDDLRYATLLATSRAAATLTTSQTEQRMLDALLRVGMPVPDRNLAFTDDNGATLTVPDFAWADAKLCVYVDGWRWHGGLDREEELKAIAASDPARRAQYLAASRMKDARDKEARSRLIELGWVHLDIADGDIDDGRSPAFAQRVRTIYDARRDPRHHITPGHTPTPNTGATAGSGVEA